MWTSELRSAFLPLGFCLLTGLLRAGEPAKPDDAPKAPPAKADARPEPAPKDPAPRPSPPGGEDIVGKIDDLVITRVDLNAARRLFSLSNPQVVPNNKQVLEQLINRILWLRYFEKNNLRPSQEDLRQAVSQLDAELRKNRNTTYQDFLAAQGVRVQEHLVLLAYELATRRLIEDIQSKLKAEVIKAEFDAHPDWYDGSRIRLSQIFVDTSNLSHDPKELGKAKERIEQIHAQLVAGKDFDRIAIDYSDGAAAGMAGDRGWFARKGADVDEPLIAPAWDIKVGECTRPILGPRGWHILKVTDREPAAFTFHGAKPRVVNELTRRRVEALFEELKAAAKIEMYF